MHWIAFQPRPEAHADAPAAAADPMADGTQAMAWLALQFSPQLARVHDTLVLEVSASERLFGGRDALCRRLLAALATLQPVQHAQGWSALLALGRLWAGAPQAAADDLPLHALQAARAHLPVLQRLGCTTWGQLRALPRAGLARRLGAELLEALDQAYGTRAEIYPWLRLPEVFDQALELPEAVVAAPALLFGARRLLAQLQLWLRLRQQGVLALELQWTLDARRSNALHVDAQHCGDGLGRLVWRTAQATQDVQHMQRLLAEQLARVQLPAPVLHMRLRTLQTQRLALATRSLLPDEVRPGDSLPQTLERLGARLGAEQVLCVQQQADHRPERMQRWQPWGNGPGGALVPDRSDGAQSVAHAAYPSWLLAQPLRLQQQHGVPQYHGPLALLAGPQRMEAGWLEGAPALRDYYVARSAYAGLVWIYRERAPTEGAAAPWYLHGLFA